MQLATQPRLSSKQVEQYRTEGYLIYAEQLFPEPMFQGLKNYFEELLTELPEDVRPESMDVPHFSYPKLHDWLLSDPVLDLVEPILGPDIVLFSSHFICKPRGNGKRVPWHEDSAYWKGMMNPVEVVTVWLAIDPSTKENGCMQVIPRTHHHGYSDYEAVDPTKNVFSTEIVKSQRDDSKAVCIELEAGQASLHDGRIMHSSAANNSNLRRCGYTMRYTSSRVKYNEERIGKYHQVYLARGRDHAGNTYADPSKTYEELARYRTKHGKNGH